MKKHLYTNAILSSPLIALFGACPLYIFNVLDVKQFVLIFIGLTINVFMAWVLHIWLILKHPNIKIVPRFIITYSINIVFRILDIMLANLFDIPKPIDIEKYIGYPIITSFAINAIIMVIAISLVNAYKMKQVEAQLQEIKLESAEAKRLVLMQQLHPHFLFNSLNILKSLIGIDAEKAEQYVLKLSDFLRYTVQSNTTELTTVAKELEFVQDYLDLQKVRFDNAFIVSINIADKYLQQKLPVLALQTLVENAFKHNHFTQKKPLHLIIEVIENNLQISNNKDVIQIADKTKTGLLNLQKRYQLIANTSIHVQDNPNQFIVKIPLLPA